MRTLLMILPCLFVFGACTKSTTTPEVKKLPELLGTQTSDHLKDGPQRFGGELTLTETSNISDVLQKPEAFVGKNVLLEGIVRKACSKMGCWMELASSADQAQAGCRITFADYGFYVPKDSMGATAKVEGTLSLKDVQKDHVDHLESEGAHFAKKNPDGSAQELQMVATAVVLERIAPSKP